MNEQTDNKSQTSVSIRSMECAYDYHTDHAIKNTENKLKNETKNKRNSITNSLTSRTPSPQQRNLIPINHFSKTYLLQQFET